MTTAPDLTADERATLERIEAAPAADEDTVERVARALDVAPTEQDWLSRHDLLVLARAAIDALKPAPGTEDEACVICGFGKEEHAGGGEMIHDFRPAPGTDSSHEARARKVLLPEVFAAERDRFIAPGTDSSGTEHSDEH